MLRRGKETPRSVPEQPEEAVFEDELEPPITLNGDAEEFSAPALVSALSLLEENGASRGPADPFVTAAPAHPVVASAPAPEPERGGRFRRSLRSRRADESESTTAPAPTPAYPSGQPAT